MKLHFASAVVGALLWSQASLIGFSADGSSVAPAELIGKIRWTAVFSEHVVPVGKRPPNTAESEALYQIVQDVFRSKGAPNKWDALEAFVKANESSPWTPSIRAGLALNYREQGRYSRALEHWEKAWEATQDSTDPEGRHVAEFVLAHWSRLLASLGRVEKLNGLIAANASRTFSHPPFYQLWLGTLEGYQVMTTRPEISYRCGTYALFEVGKQLKGPQFPRKELLGIPSPTNGFSVATLVEVAGRHGLNLVASRRKSGDAIPVPSVIHWRQKHYAAVLERSGEYYKVIDPTFGHEQWLSQVALNEEASGVFIAEPSRFKGDWTPLEAPLMASTRGQGYPNNIDDSDDVVCQPNQDLVNGAPNPENQCAGCGEGPGVADVSSIGMPKWRVSEPYITLWLTDEPLGYQPGQGDRVSFRLHYKHRETRSNGNLYGVGPQWSLDWQSYVHPLGSGSSAEVFFGGGGSQVLEDNTLSFGNRLKLVNSVDTSTIFYPDGSQDVYKKAFGRTLSFGLHDFLLSERINRFGQKTTFEYESTNSIQPRLFTVVDALGARSSVRYGEAASGTTDRMLITSVEDPWGRVARLYYNDRGFLRKIVDTQKNETSFEYDENGVLKSMTTPYGTTAFSIQQTTPSFVTNTIVNPNGSKTTNVTSYAFGGTNVNRSILITEPENAHQLYVYRDNSRFLNASDLTEFLPNSYPLPDTAPFANQFEAGLLFYRNSFHWNRQQFESISPAAQSNPQSLTKADYAISRRKHWFHKDNEKVGSVLSMIQEASPDGVKPGQITWYDYEGRLGPNAQGTQNEPLFVARILEDGTSWYARIERNTLGNPTKIASTYSVGGVRTVRTNLVEYDQSGLNPVSLKLIVKDSTNHLGGIFYEKSKNRPRYFTNAVGEVATTIYDIVTPPSVGRLLNVQSFSGLDTVNTYYASGSYANWLQKIEQSSIGLVREFTYNRGLVETYKDERGLLTTNFWDDLGRFTGRTYPDGSSVTNIYDRLHLYASKNRQDQWTFYEFDSLQRLKAVTDPLTNRTEFGYCGCGGLSSITEGVGTANLKTTIQRDFNGRPTKITRNDNSWTQFTYSGLGRLLEVTDSTGFFEHRWYNNQGLLTLVSNQFGIALSVDYDHLDRPTKIVNSLGIAVTQEFDGLNRLKARRYPDQTSELFEYDKKGLWKYTSRLQIPSTFDNDLAGRRTSQTLGGSSTTKFGYSAAGDILRLDVGFARTTQWTYDLYGNQIARVDKASNTNFIQQYSANGWLTNRWTPEKGWTKYQYDLVGNLTNIDYPNSPDISFVYDPIGRLKQMKDAVGTSTYLYGSNGRLQTENGPWDADQVTYGYQGRYRQSTRFTLPQTPDWVQTAGYDSAGRLKTLSDRNGTYTYYYQGAGSALKGLSYPNGAGLTNQYETLLGRLSGRSFRNPAGNLLDSSLYVYDAQGNLTNQVRFDGSSMGYAYDGAGQLIRAEATELSGTVRQHEQFGYGYDAGSNLQVRTNNALITIFNSDNNDQVTTARFSGTLTVSGAFTGRATNVTVNGAAATLYNDNTFALSGVSLASGSSTFKAIGKDRFGRQATASVSVNLPATNGYTHDLNGNLTRDGFLSYGYDDANQLVSITNSATSRSRFVFDGLGRKRIRYEDTYQSGNWVTTSETRYVYDGMLPVQERDGANVVKALYSRGADLSGGFSGAGGIGGLLARTAPDAFGGKVAYYGQDRAGNVSLLMSTAGSVVARYAYDPFGGQVAATGPMAAVNPFRFSGKEYHAPSATYDFGFRTYHPGLQRWTARDPIGELGGINLYGYVGNDPLNTVDPLGLWGVQFGTFNIGHGDPSYIFDSDVWNETKDRWHTGLDAIGTIEPTPFADGLNGILYGLEGDLGNAGISALGMIPYAGDFAKLGKYGKKACRGGAKGLAPAKRASGSTVLGHYPEYSQLADSLGHRRFDIPKQAWDRMTDAERWAANQKFLDRTISRGDEIILSTPLDRVRPGSYFARELEYLSGKGYRPSADGTRLIPGGN